MAVVTDGLKSEGRKPYVIPGGGSNPIGATGYVACALEILSQTFESEIAIDRVVTASGSSGTHAGLVTGFEGADASIPVVGINVSRPKDAQEEKVYDLMRQTSERLGVRSEIPRDKVLCFGDYVGPGYSLPTPEMGEAIRMLARLEGVLLDPVYTGKTMAGLIDLARNGFFKKDENVLFIHTGGSPALYAYPEIVLD